MVLSLIKKVRNNDLRLEVPVHDFIPFACHYDEHTILTKNGELLQTIKLVGFSYETVGAEQVNLRDTVREAILKTVKSEKVAIWFHTVRTKRSLDPSEGIIYDNVFAQETHMAWNNKNYWNDKYVNELYITVIHEGRDTKLHNLNDTLLSFSYISQLHMHEESLHESYKNLQETVDSMLYILEQYGAKRLGIMTDKEGAFSELLQFFDKIIHMKEERISVPLVELSKYLATHRIAFGNNSFEVRNRNKKYFGAILSIKEYSELSGENIDVLLQLPIQLVVTQYVEFANSKKILKKFEYQNYINSLTNDQELYRYTGLDNFVDDHESSYGYHQLTVTIIAENVNNLNQAVKRTASALSRLGVIAVQEDINIESCFWSQLPANFSYLCRKLPINIKFVGGFASLHNFPAGKISNEWGKAVTLFRTALGTPYFFNFHYESSGHTSIVGPYSSGKTTLTNFLLTESCKFSPNIFLIDQKYRSNLTIKAIKGVYKELVLNDREPSVHLNPLSLPESEENILFMNKWFSYIIWGLEIDQSTSSTLDIIAKMVEKLYKLPLESRKLKYIEQLFPDDMDVELRQSFLEKFSIWREQGEYASLFDHVYDDNLDQLLSQKRVGLDITKVLNSDEKMSLLLVSYLMHKFLMFLDGEPSIIVLNDAWSILNNKVMAKELDLWLTKLTKKNAVALIGLEINTELKVNYISDILVKKMDTQIFLPDHKVEMYKEAFTMSEQEFKLIQSMKVMNRHFLLKQGPYAIVAELNLAGLDHIISILSGSESAVKLANEVIKERGDNADSWLPIFYQRISELKIIK